MDDRVDQIGAARDVDAGWLAAVLRNPGTDVSHRLVEVVARSIGTGQVGENVRFELTGDDSDAVLPATVVGKSPSSEARTCLRDRSAGL